MTQEAYDKKMWRGLHNLQSALSTTKLDDHHYEYSSGHYNKFDSLSDLLKISLLVIENIDQLPNSGGEKIVKEIMNLANELQHNAEQLSELSYCLKNEAQRWAERSSRASNID